MRALAIALAALLLLPAAAAAQDCPQTSLADVEDEVMCPVCGTPLGLASEAPQAEREREYIQELIARCKSKDEVKQALVAEFGESVLALPGDQGDDDLGDVLVYAVPAVGILVASAGIAFAVVRWRRRARTGSEPGGPAMAGADGSRLEDDMDRYEL
ncbi:MAG TPA: cytochrome c-type biogenesis protein CcmH [Thermoleophilaceae bacterium]|nr:cytochrome c-type biogenesis protein CcmH [Thermoleophilaceae bacterium]